MAEGDVRLQDRPTFDGVGRQVQQTVVALVIDAVYPYSRGGRELRYHELTRRLADRATVHVFTMRWWEGPRILTEGNVTFHGITRLHPMYAKRRRSIRQAVFFALACLRLAWHDFDVLEADHIPYLPLLVLRLIATLKRKRFVVTWHEVWGLSYWRKYLGWLGYGAWLIEWLSMHLPDHIVAASEQTADRLAAVLRSRAQITVAPNGIDLETIRAAHADAASTDIIAVGRLMAHKRVDLLLEAIAALRGWGIPVTGRIVGDGPDKAALHDQAEFLGISPFVEFRHDVEKQEEIYGLIKSARVFVSPSAREGFGIAVLEALACGVKVVTTDSPDNLSQYLVARSANGVICRPSPTALAKTIMDLLKDPVSTSHGQVIDSWLVDYSWEEMTSQVIAALELEC